MSNFKFPDLKRFCYCMRLVTGVRVMTGMALILGDAYIIMGAGLYDDFIPLIFIKICAVSYFITGGLFCLWFLLLLVFQSTSGKYPRIMVLMQTKLLAAWLIFMFFLLVFSLYILHRNKELVHDAFAHDEELLVYGILCTVFGIISTSYNFLILQSYINTLEEAIRESSDISSVRFLSYLSEDLEDRISELPKLSAINPLQRERMMKSFKNEYKRRGIMPPPNIKASQISVLSDSHVSLLSAVSSSREEDREQKKTNDKKESDLSPMKQNENNESQPMKKGRENESPPMKQGKEIESSPMKKGKEIESSSRKQEENESPPMKQGKEGESSPPKQNKESESSPPKQRKESAWFSPKQPKENAPSSPRQSKDSESSSRKQSGESESSSRKPST